MAAVLLLAPAALAQKPIGERPDAARPTPVDFAVYLHDLTRVDSVRLCFHADVMMVMRWRDARLADDTAQGLRTFEPNEVWHPRVVMLNQQDAVSPWLEQIEVTPDGVVTLRTRWIGEFTTPLDLSSFPFDRQRLELRFACATYTEAEVRFDGSALADRMGPSRALAIPDWNVDGWAVEVGSPRELVPLQRAGFTLGLQLERRPGYYLAKVILPLALIVFMSWIVFWIDPREIGSQIGVATTSMLTLIAYRFSLDQLLPPVSYLTRMDVYVLGSTVLVFLSLVEVTLTSRYAMQGRTAEALRLDRWSRVLFPLLFTLLLLGAFLA